MRVLHLTDPHLFADPSGELRGTVTYASLQQVLDHHRDSGWQADIVSCTGDLIQDDSAEAYEHFKSLLGPLGLPVHCVPGNHDVRALMQAALDAPPFFYCDTAELGGWLMIGLDSCVSEQAGGAVSDDELDRFDAALAASDAAHVLVCLHHPPVPMGSEWLDTVGLDAGDAFLARINASGRVRLMLFGHVHQAYDRRHGNVQVIATPSTCRQFKPKSKAFAVDQRPPAYRRLTLRPDGSFDNELVWIDDA
ncbi:MAG: phosphodiesterase [Woeseiaceae bacterium]|nr:phosphodiesterase [Woeseiaceae bacterium]